MVILTTAVVVPALFFAARGWYRRALAHQAAQDAAALAQYAMGRSFSHPSLGAAYDKSKAARHYRRTTATAAHARRKSRAAQTESQPAKVTPIRRQA